MSPWGNLDEFQNQITKPSNTTLALRSPGVPGAKEYVNVCIHIDEVEAGTDAEK